jgi:flagellar hook-associated protein 3 FlgL
MQETLGQMLTGADELAIDLSSAAARPDLAAALLHAGTARTAFADAVGLLNTQVAGQSLFAGTATDGAALAPADAILAELDAIAAAAPDAASASAAIDAYFAKSPPGGFRTGGYLGAAQDLTPVAIGDGQRLDYGVRADEDRIVAVLKAEAKAAVVAGGAFAARDGERLALIATAGTDLLAAKEGLQALRSEIGSRQEAVEDARAARVSERETLGLARTAIVATDPLEAASAYQTLQVQLETIYTITARLASLRFTNFLR